MIGRLSRVAFAAILAASPVSGALAHGGGLDSSGCHRETATGGYHCHRSKGEDEDDDTLKYVGMAAGAVVLGYVIWRWLECDEEASDRSLNLHFAPAARADPERSGAYYGVSWKLRF